MIPLLSLLSTALAVPPGFGPPPDLPAENTPAPIINGVDALTEDFPSAGVLLAQIEVNGQGGILFVCSSTLIAPDVVLAAAHCVDIDLSLEMQIGSRPSLTFYWTRELDVSRYSTSAQSQLPVDVVKVRATVKHPEWVGLQGSALGLGTSNDIALFFLDEVLSTPNPAILPTREEGAALTEGDALTVVGWGARANSRTAPAGLKQIGTTVLSVLGTNEMKVGELSTDVRKCFGDSGGPSYRQFPDTTSTETWRVVGVTSHSFDESDCASTGGIDTRVDPYLGWLDEAMTAACDSGDRVGCDDPTQWGVLPPPAPPEPEKGGCGCSSLSSTGSGFGGLLLAVTLLMRRRNG